MVLSTFGFHFKEQRSEATSHKSCCAVDAKSTYQHSHLGKALSFLESFSRLDRSLWYGQKGHTALVFFGRIPHLPSTWGKIGAGYKQQMEITKPMRAAKARAWHHQYSWDYLSYPSHCIPGISAPVSEGNKVSDTKAKKPLTPKFCLLNRYSARDTEICSSIWMITEGMSQPHITTACFVYVSHATLSLSIFHILQHRGCKNWGLLQKQGQCPAEYRVCKVSVQLNSILQSSYLNELWEPKTTARSQYSWARSARSSCLPNESCNCFILCAPSEISVI